MAAGVDDLRARLDTIAEELADLALQRLQAAVEAGATRAPPDERVITRARRSVEKAASLLGSLDGEPGGDRT